MDGFPFVHEETVRFSDLDGMGHVNNDAGQSSEVPERWRRRIESAEIAAAAPFNID